MIPEQKEITFAEFMEEDKLTEELREYIDGVIYNMPSPSTMHQRVSFKLGYALGTYFNKKSCEVFSAPFDIVLSNEKETSNSKIIPDLSVICDKTGLDEKNYVGVPTLIVEILSPSNQGRDLITKMNLYQRFGVKEYWIVNPKLKIIQIYTLDESGNYEQWGVYKESEVAESSVFCDLRISLQDIF